MDDIDNMQARLEFEEIISRHSSKKDEPAKEATGYCWHCGEPTKTGRWCDAECRDQWQKEEGYL